MRKLFTVAAVCFAAMGLGGCSLLKVSVSTGEPFTESENDLRMATRGFWRTFSTEVIRAADSIAACTADPDIRMRAVRWKLDATRAATSAALKATPELAAVETWVLCADQLKALEAMPDADLFGPLTPVARSAARRLERTCRGQLEQAMDAGRFALMAEFVERHGTAEVPDRKAAGPDASSEWMDFTKERGVPCKRSVGSVPEVIAYAGDRMEGYADQASRDLSYGKELLEYRLGRDSTYARLARRLDGMERDFDRMVAVAEGLPGVSAAMLDSLSMQARDIMQLMAFMVDDTFEGIDFQRREMQDYISGERESIMDGMRQMADESLRTVLSELPALVGKVAGWIILLVIVVLGAPFLAGFLLGRMYGRRSERKRNMYGY